MIYFICVGENAAINLGTFNGKKIHVLKLHNEFHFSSIKDIRIKKNIVVTSGYDQMVSIFAFDFNELILLKQIKSCISEINTLDFSIYK